MRFGAPSIGSLVLLCACLSGGAAVAQQGPGPGPSGPKANPGLASKGTEFPEFDLSVCNKSQEPMAFVAIGSRISKAGPGEHETRVQGWWKVPQGQCTKIGKLPTPGFIFHARTVGNVGWSGKIATQICVNLNDAFNATIGSSKPATECPSGQALIPFSFVGVPSTSATFDLRLNNITR